MKNIIIHPEQEASACVIWLHGLGADGHDFAQIVPELRLPEDLAVKFVFPHAPERAVTINGGVRQRAWFDIASADRSGLEADRVGLEESSEVLRQLVEDEIANGIPAKRIIVAGFSQGGAVALHTAINFKEPLGGVMGLSTYLPKWMTVSETDTPFFMAHGSYDPLLPNQLGMETKTMLLDAGCHVEWHEYAMAHEVCYEEIQDISHWLGSVLSNSGKNSA